MTHPDPCLTLTHIHGVIRAVVELMDARPRCPKVTIVLHREESLGVTKVAHLVQRHTVGHRRIDLSLQSSVLHLKLHKAPEMKL